jgi:hypothetical protein
MNFTLLNYIPMKLFKKLEYSCYYSQTIYFHKYERWENMELWNRKVIIFVQTSITIGENKMFNLCHLQYHQDSIYYLGINLHQIVQAYSLENKSK